MSAVAGFKASWFVHDDGRRILLVVYLIRHMGIMCLFVEVNQICYDFISEINTKPTDKLTKCDLSNINFRYLVAVANERLQPLFDFNLSDDIHRHLRRLLCGGDFANEIDLHGNTCVTHEINNEMYSMHFQCVCYESESTLRIEAMEAKNGSERDACVWKHSTCEPYRALSNEALRKCLLNQSMLSSVKIQNIRLKSI